MRILVSNDDGIYSPGIAALAEVASEFGEVRVVAPDMERSSAGHSITSTHPLAYHPAHVGELTAWRVNGTPADCVALGAFKWEKVDLVLSGLNMGLNLGNSIWHSGTVAAAKQAALLGMRGIAFSAPSGLEPDYECFKPWIRRALHVLIDETALPLVNVNFPRNPKGLVWTRASVRRYDGAIVPTTHPLGRELYWFTVRPITGAEAGTDRWAMEQGWGSMTPLRLDLTQEEQLQELRARRPLDEQVAVAVSPATSSPEAAEKVVQDEASSTTTNAVQVETAHTPEAPGRS